MLQLVITEGRHMHYTSDVELGNPRVTVILLKTKKTPGLFILCEDVLASEGVADEFLVGVGVVLPVVEDWSEWRGRYLLA